MKCYSDYRHANPQTVGACFPKGNIPWDYGKKRPLSEPSQRKGKKLEEIYGETRGKELKAKCREMGRRSKEIELKRVMSFKEDFEKQGYRFIPIVHRIPDAILVKDNRVFALEVERQGPGSADLTKYENWPFYDDIIWIFGAKKRRFT
jgi:hypothetical protein